MPQAEGEYYTVVKIEGGTYDMGNNSPQAVLLLNYENNDAILSPLKL